MKARLIRDSGSQKLYISANLRNELKLPSESVTLSIKTFGSETVRMQTCDAVELGLKTKLGLDLELTLYVVPFICEPLYLDSQQTLQWSVSNICLDWTLQTQMTQITYQSVS